MDQAFKTEITRIDKNFQHFSMQHDDQFEGILEGKQRVNWVESIINKPFADARDFGVIGNGLTNDRDAIQKAVNSLSGGGTLIIPTGNYKVSGPINIENNNITILGAGWNSRIILSSDDDLFVISGDGCRVFDLMLEGTGTIIKDNSYQYSLLRGTGDDLRIENCYLYKPISYGITVYGGLRARVRDNYIVGTITGWTTGTYHAGIGLHNAIKAHVEGNTIDRCVQGILLGLFGVASQDDDGEDSNETRDATICNNKIYRSGNNGIYQYGTAAIPMRRNVFSGNVIKFNQNGSGMRIHGDSNLIIGNEIYSPRGSSGNGISVADPTNTIISNNIIRDANLRGIVISRTNPGVIENIIISDNMIYNPATRGIQIDEAGATDIRGVKILGNHVEGAATDGIYLNNTTDRSEISICDNTVKACDGYGILVKQIINSMVSNNIVSNSGKSGAPRDGIRLNACDDNIVNGNRCFDTRGTKYQDYGIKEANGSDWNHIGNNHLRGNGTAGILTVGANTITPDNL